MVGLGRLALGAGGADDGRRFGVAPPGSRVASSWVGCGDRLQLLRRPGGDWPHLVQLPRSLPTAAAGVFVTSKLVEKQVDRLSSISYDVTGPWDDITVAVDQIFAAELKAQVVEEKPAEAMSEEAVAEPTPEQ